MSNITPNGKVAIITGANSGIGRVTARELALQGYHVFLACRSEDKTQPVLAEIARLSNGTAYAEFLPLDLGDLASVKGCAALFLARKLPLHVLVCNVPSCRRSPYRRPLRRVNPPTAAGGEHRYQIMHLRRRQDQRPKSGRLCKTFHRCHRSPSCCQ